MSTIGRVFVVLNLILAAVFVGFAGTFLQRQHNWKQEYEKKVETSDTTIRERDVTIADMTQKLANLNNAKELTQNNLDQANRELAQARDEIKRLEDSKASFEADVKRLASIADSTKTAMEAAFARANETFNMAVADQKTRDEAVRAKDIAQAENRDLKNKVAALEETITNKDVQIASLNKDISEKGLLLDVAYAKGFTPSMAVPQLAGTVTAVTGRLCTISVTENPTDAEIKPGYEFAIYDASGYKGEARVTAVDAERKAAFCTLTVQNGNVREGDKASTQLAGTN